MGYYNHHVMAVIGWDRKMVTSARRRAKRGGLSVTSVITSQFGSHSFFVGPDGSKEGWTDSDRGDAVRAGFVQHLDALRHEDGSSPLRWCIVELPEDGAAGVVLCDVVKP